MLLRTMTQFNIRAKKLKYYLRRYAVKGRLLWLWSFFRCLESLWKFHPPRRFINFWHYFFITRFGKYRVLKLAKRINRGVFYLCLDRDKGGDFILKIPHLKKHYSYSLFKSLRDPQKFTEYSNLLRNLANDQLYGKHFPVVYQVRRDGGYLSFFMRGINMNRIREALRRNEKELDPGIDPERLIEAVNELLKNLKNALEKYGYLNGDWAPHNLIYNPETNIIYNVDLEGMYIYGSDNVEANMKYIESELRSIITAMKIRIGKEPGNEAILETLPIIAYATDTEVSYSGNAFFTGYHSLKLGDKYFNGQRNPFERLKKVPYDFSGKVVLDIGCNTGGMLFSLADKITIGVGIDGNSRAINAANLISCLNHTKNLHFYTFDLENDDINLIDNFFLGKKVDICFLLSICIWVKNCRQVIAYASRAAEYLLFETNGSPLQQKEQVEWLNEFFNKAKIIEPESLDDPNQRNRELYLCRDNR
jgi:2-polyprenyl-3-methyl-5-hydroxy-6-metoxy-1,4-benzoquinol methylase